MTWYVPHNYGQSILCRILFPNQRAPLVSRRIAAEALLLDAAHPGVGLRHLLVHGERALHLLWVSHDQVLAGLRTLAQQQQQQSL